MTNFIGFLVPGIFLGCMWGLVALGVVFVFKSTQVFNFAQPYMAMLLVYPVCTLGVRFGAWWGLLCGVVCAIVFGFIFERLFMRRLIGQDPVAAVIITIMFSYVILGIIGIAWHTKAYSVPFSLGKPIILAGARISSALIWGIAMAFALFGLFAWFYWRTMLGRVMRATAEDHQVAQSMGIPVRLVFSLSWMMAGFLAMIAGLFVGMTTGVHWTMWEALSGGVIVAIIGGLESMGGAVLAGLILGLATTLTSGYMGPWARYFVPYIMLLVIIAVLPYGLFGLKRIERL